MSIGRLSLWCALCLLWVAPTVLAQQPCPPLAQWTVLYPVPCATDDCKGGTLSMAHDGQLLLRRNQRTGSMDLKLYTVGDERQVPAEVVFNPGSVLARLVPDSPLKPRANYELRVGDQPLLRFQAKKVRASAAPDKPRASIAFTHPGLATPADAKGMVKREGRSAWLKLETGGKRVVAVRVEGSFLDRRDKSTRVDLVGPYINNVWVANQIEGCHSLLPAPNWGTYSFDLVPWYEGGVKGQRIRIDGVIR